MVPSRKNMLRVLVAVAVLVTAFASTFVHAETVDRPRGIVLFIGDGMGINQVRSAAIYSEKILSKPLAMDSFPTRGTTTTYSSNSEVTDSAAAATALYTGYKTKNGAINILPDGKKASTIGEAAKKAGLSVGVVSTARVTDATPAGVFGHTPDRREEDLIAEQLLEFGADVALGGGSRHFLPAGQKGSKRKDDKNVLESMKAAGYAYVTTAAELQSIDPATTPKLFGLFAPSVMAYEIDRQHDAKLAVQPDLAEMTRVALAILGRNPRGFFVMIEGGRIDHACHAHDLKASIYDTLAFDKAVNVGLEYQKAHPDVLVLVSADHETGGMGLGRGTEYALNIIAMEPIKSSLEQISKKMEKHPGDSETIIKDAGFALTEREQALLGKHAPDTKIEAVSELQGEKMALPKYTPTWVHYALGLIESERSKVGWTTFAHTAQPVITFAVGPGAGEFAGGYDNTDIAKKMTKLLGLTLDPPAEK